MKKQMNTITAPVETWRYWARTITEKCGWSWETIEANERTGNALGRLPVVGLGESVYWAMEHAKDAPRNIVEEAASELLARLLPLAERWRSRDNDEATRATNDFCNACRRFPASLRRLMERPADTPAVPVAAVDGAGRTRRVRYRWTNDERKAFMEAMEECGLAKTTAFVDAPDSRSHGGCAKISSELDSWCNRNPDRASRLSRVKGAKAVKSILESIRDAEKRGEG